MFRVSFIGILTLFFVGCSPKSTVVLLESKKVNNSVLVSTNKGEAKLNQVGAYVDLVDKDSAPKKVKTMSKSEIESRFAKALATTPLKPLSYIVYFKFDSTELTEPSKAILQEALEKIKERSPCTVDVIGHTDTLGSSQLNQKISLERAQSIESIIKQQKLEVVSLVAKGFGEEDLLVQTKNNKAEPRNRNVEIFIK
jgi:outer membrane protein OmpA-like peptidoglycan-associated protein